MWRSILNMTQKPTLALYLLLLLAATADGEVYKWTDENGKVHFGDRPPTDATTEQVEIKVNSVTGPPTVEQLGPDKKSNVKSARNKQVIIYTTERCGYCKQAIAYFRKKGISYTKYDVETSAKGKRDYKKLGGGGVPIIKIGSKLMHGFSQARFDSIYNAD